jgi:hypothetical protein
VEHIIGIVNTPANPVAKTKLPVKKAATKKTTTPVSKISKKKYKERPLGVNPLDKFCHLCYNLT